MTNGADVAAEFILGTGGRVTTRRDARRTELAAIRSPERPQTNPQQFPQHAETVADHRHLRLAAIVPLDRHLDDAKALLAGDGQHLHVEGPPVNRHERENGFAPPRR